MDVFLFGAGFSRILHKEMPLMKDLGRLIKKSDIYLPSQPTSFKNSDNAEDLLSYLSEELPWESESLILKKKAAFIELSQLIGKSIGEQQSSCSRPDSVAPAFFQKILTTLPALITLNYDTLLEQSLDLSQQKTGEKLDWKSLYPIPLSLDISRGGGMTWGTYPKKIQPKIFKLHGSVNWFYSGKSSFYGETLYLKHQEAIQAIGAKEMTADKTPLIIPPTYSKSSFFNNETVRLLWRMAQKELSQARRLIIFGYSFPETDSVIKTLLQETVKDHVEVIVINPDPAVKERVSTAMGNKKITYFDKPVDPHTDFFNWYISEDT